MRAVVLDMYGVIVKQTGDDFVPYVQQTFPHLEPEDVYEHWFKADVGELTSLEVWEKLGFEGDLEKLEKEYLDTIKLNEDFIEFISSISKTYKTAIISNDSSRWSKYLRDKFNINKYFYTISISGGLKIQKPDKRIFHHTINNLGCKLEDCIYVDDREGNLNVASELGMKAIMFNSRNVEYSGNLVNGFKELERLIKLEKV